MKICVVGDVLNHVCQVSKWNFQGLQFYKGSNFPFSYWFWMGLTTVQRYCAACDKVGNISLRDTLHYPSLSALNTRKTALMTFSCVRGKSHAYFHSIYCPDAEVSQLRKAHWTPQDKKLLHSVKFPCCCTNCLEQSAKTPYWWGQFVLELKTFIVCAGLLVKSAFENVGLEDKALYKRTYLLIHLLRNKKYRHVN